MAEAIKEAYSDIFLIKAKPSVTDKKAIEGKFKSFHNVSDNVAELMCKTFLALLAISDLENNQPVQQNTNKVEDEKDTLDANETNITSSASVQTPHAHASLVSGLHYNIQIHLPATKDIEVYNSIFKSLKEHLLEE
jgi:hypothetical protein